MAASLLIMVSSIALKGKEEPKNRDALENAMKDLYDLRDELVLLSEEDAKAYDNVVVAAGILRRKRDDSSQNAYEKAVERASEVPERTAEACLLVLEHGSRLFRITKKSTLSDLGTAVALAQAGVRGAYLNVMVNLEVISDREFGRLKRSRLNEICNQADALTEEVLGSMSTEKGGPR